MEPTDAYDANKKHSANTRHNSKKNSRVFFSPYSILFRTSYLEWLTDDFLVLNNKEPPHRRVREKSEFENGILDEQRTRMCFGF